MIILNLGLFLISKMCLEIVFLTVHMIRILPAISDTSNSDYVLNVT